MVVTGTEGSPQGSGAMREMSGLAQESVPCRLRWNASLSDCTFSLVFLPSLHLPVAA